MRDIDKYDEEVKNIDLEEVARQKQKRADIKARMLFFGMMLVYHIVACIVYTVTLSPTAEAQMIYGRESEARLLAFFSVVAIAMFAFITSLELIMNGEARDNFTDRMKGEKLSPKLFWSLSKKSILSCGIMYFIFQFPYAVFHHFFGFEYVSPIIIDNLYTLDAGLMELTRLGIVGAVLNTLLFSAFHALIRYFTYVRWKKDIL